MSLSIRKQKKRLYRSRNRSKVIVISCIKVQRYSVDQKQWVFDTVKLKKAIVLPKH